MVYGVQSIKPRNLAHASRAMYPTHTHTDRHTCCSMVMVPLPVPTGAVRCGALFADFDMAARALATSFSRLFAIIRERGGGLLISHFSFFILLCNSARN